MSKQDYLTLDDFDCKGKTVLLRTDINSPIASQTKKITNETRLDKSLPTIRALTEGGAKLVIMAHQGDTLDYQNLISLSQHAQKISQKLGKSVQFIDDVAGPAAREKIKNLKEGEILLLDNLRFLIEEVSTFENDVKLTPEEMTHTYLVKNLAPLADYYVNDAFSAAHRNSPSMVAFQEVLPSAAGILYTDEVGTLTKIVENPQHPCVFLLGGAKVSDSFSIMEVVLSKGSADYVLTAGLTGLIMLMALGKGLGSPTERFIADRGLEQHREQAKRCLDQYSERILEPVDFGVDQLGKRGEVTIDDLPVKWQIIDIGPETVAKYQGMLERAATIFVNGPAGVYEKAIGAYGTKELWEVIASSKGYSVIGGGDTVASASRFSDLARIGYVSTGGGALTRFLAGVELPLVQAMKKACRRWGSSVTS